MKPNPVWLKLNVDGSSCNNTGESSDDRKLRNNNEGILLFSFAEYTGFGSNNRAELLALLFGLRRCMSCGFLNVIH